MGGYINPSIASWQAFPQLSSPSSSLSSSSPPAMTALDPTADIDEQTPLLPPSGEKKERVTPLPMVQLSTLMLLQLAEPITSQCIYPFINQVRAGVPSIPHQV